MIVSAGFCPDNDHTETNESKEPVTPYNFP
jgi:hypothetical protein